MRKFHVRSKASGFTLIELLVTITIIAVLMTLLLVVINMVRDRADRIVCAGNLRQIGMALQTYAADNNGLVPPTQFSVPVWNSMSMAWAGIWFGFLQPYMPPSGAAPAWHCPGSVFSLQEARKMPASEQMVNSYGYNEFPWQKINVGEFSRRIAQINRPSEVIIIGDRWGTRDGIGVKTQGAIKAPYKNLVMTGVLAQSQPASGLKWEEGSVRVSHSAGSGNNPKGGRFNFLSLDGHLENGLPGDTYGPGNSLRIPNRWEGNF